MLEAFLRPHIQALCVDPVAKRCHAIPANLITLASCISGLLCLPALMAGWSYTATLLLVISGYLDILDGTVARFTLSSSAWGSILDIFADRLVELAVIIGLFAIDPSTRAWPALAMLGSCYLCITSFLVVGIHSSNHGHKSFFYSVGLIERAEAFLFFVTMIWLPHAFVPLAVLFVSLVTLTAVLHLYQFVKTSP